MKNDTLNQKILQILKEELIPAMGCTEPIAISYAAALLREKLGYMPDRLIAECSGNIIKNVRCVRIPSSDGMIGIESAMALGAIGGDASLKMNVLSSITSTHRREAQKYIENGCCQVRLLHSDTPLHFIIRGVSNDSEIMVEVQYSHLNVVKIEKDHVVLFRKNEVPEQEKENNRSILNIHSIKRFADDAQVDELDQMFHDMISMNMDIAEEGMNGHYGIGLGKLIRETENNGCFSEIKAYTASASEARMDGCNMPVVINSGSGNQGIASSVPVIVFCRKMGIPYETMLRGLAVSTLLTIYQKEFIGRLSAFCGAVSASCASGAAITYLCGGDESQICATIDNMLADIPGVICDGAKITCAAKIASCLDAAFMAHKLAMAGKRYSKNNGILRNNADETIKCIGFVGREGMRQTDCTILKAMLSDNP